MRWRPITTLALLAACLALPASAAAHADAAAHGYAAADRGVAATTSHVSASLSGVGTPAKTRLTIKLNGRKLYDQHVRSQFCGRLCDVTALTPGRSPLKVLDVESSGQPDVLLGLYSGGAHCCFVDQVFSLDPGTMTYVKVEHNFLDAGAKIVKLDAHYEFVSADARIAEAGYTDFADSGAPVQIWRVIDRRFVNVTRQYPALIKPDAARWMNAFRHHVSNGAGFIAAWAADEDLLGNSKLVASTLAGLARRHQLRSTLGLPHRSETAFVAELQKDLRALGYAS
ncbi:MAG TPA: hypothetical protein VIK04_12380 [Solirubrobacteraceae bacterium]